VRSSFALRHRRQPPSGSAFAHPRGDHFDAAEIAFGAEAPKLVHDKHATRALETTPVASTTRFPAEVAGRV